MLSNPLYILLLAKSIVSKVSKYSINLETASHHDPHLEVYTN